MKTKKFFSFLAVATALTLASCSSKTVSSDDAARRLVAGETPAVLVSVKLKDLLDKGGITSKENIPMVAQMLFSEKVEFFTNPEKAGLDLSGKSYLAVSPTGHGHAAWALTGIKNKEDFEKMLKEEGNDKFEEIEGYNTLQEDDKFLAAWNEKNLLLVVATEGKVKEKFKTYAGMLDDDKDPGDNYKKFFDANTDIAFFNDYSKAMALQENMPHQAQDERAREMMKKMAEKLKGSYGVTTVNFENDKVVMDVSNNLTDAAKKEFDFVSTTGFPKELLAHLGSKELTGFISINTDLRQLAEWLMAFSPEYSEMMAQAKEQTGIDIDRILASLKGNVLMAFQGTMKVALPYYEASGVPDSMSVPRVSVIAAVSDNYVEQVVDSILKDQKEGGYYWLNKGFNPQYLAFKPSVLFYTNDPKMVTGTGTPVLEARAEEVLDKPFAFYFDLHTIIASGNNRGAQDFADKFKYAYGSMDINGGHAELILDNGGKNSLWTLINLGVESTADMMPQM